MSKPDIVWALRDQAAIHNETLCGDVCRGAADEIERLRDEHKNLVMMCIRLTFFCRNECLQEQANGLLERIDVARKLLRKAPEVSDE